MPAHTFVYSYLNKKYLVRVDPSIIEHFLSFLFGQFSRNRITVYKFSFLLLQVASSFGTSEGTKELENIVDKINPNCHDFLMKLPGINSKNIHTLMRRVTNMKALLKLTQVCIKKSQDDYNFNELLIFSQNLLKF